MPKLVRTKSYFVSLGMLMLATCLRFMPSGRLALAPAEATPGPAPGCEMVSFGVLGSYKWTDPVLSSRGAIVTSCIPDTVRSLDGKKVSILGFMVPLGLSHGKINKFALCRNRGFCCYGVVPTINEIILCDVPPSEHCNLIMDTPMRISGKLDVGEQMAKGKLLYVYHMKVSSADEP
ncbi:MAG TPA: DUF3299 domain-containing protein [Candidatus Xenobia bacterium]|jgi:hypothetical protein